MVRSCITWSPLLASDIRLRLRGITVFGGKVDIKRRQKDVRSFSPEAFKAIFERGALEQMELEQNSIRQFAADAKQFLRDYSKLMFLERYPKEVAELAIEALGVYYTEPGFKPVFDDVHFLTYDDRPEGLSCSFAFHKYLALNLGYWRQATAAYIQAPEAPLGREEMLTGVTSEFLTQLANFKQSLAGLDSLVQDAVRQNYNPIAIAGGIQAVAEEIRRMSDDLIAKAIEERSPKEEPKFDDLLWPRRRNPDDPLSGVEQAALKAIWHIEFDGTFGKSNPAFDFFGSLKAYQKAVYRMKKRLEKDFTDWKEAPTGRPRNHQE